MPGYNSYLPLPSEDIEMTSAESMYSTEDSKGSNRALGEGITDATEFAVSPTGTLVDEDNPYFVRDLEYTKEEEAKVIRILDTRLFPWILLTTFVLNMDRTNNSNAISDNLPADLGFTIDTVNTATAIYSVLFSIACLSGAVIAKLAGPARCKLNQYWPILFHCYLSVVCYTGIPILMFSWGLVTLAHALISNKAGYLTGMCFILGLYPIFMLTGSTVRCCKLLRAAFVISFTNY